MRNILIAAMLVSVTAAPGESLAAASSAITQVFGQLDRCLAKNDAKCVGELVVDDATFVVPSGGAELIKGKAQIVKTLQDLMGAAKTDGPKQRHVIKNVRMIGADRAIVDCTIEVAGSAAPQESYHAVVVMVLKGSEWFFEDLRSYVVGPAAPPAGAAVAAPPAAAPAAPPAAAPAAAPKG